MKKEIIPYILRYIVHRLFISLRNENLVLDNFKQHNDILYVREICTGFLKYKQQQQENECILGFLTLWKYSSFWGLDIQQSVVKRHPAFLRGQKLGSTGLFWKKGPNFLLL